MQRWEFGFALPNMRITEPFGTKKALIVPPDDERVQDLCARIPQVDAILSSFTCTFGRPFTPPVMIMLLPDQETSMMEDMLNVRNALAISSLIRNWGAFLRRMRHGSSSQDYLFSDYFDFCPIVPGPNGMLTATSGFLLGADDSESFRGQCSPSLVYRARNNCTCDERLAEQLLGLESLRTTEGKTSEIESVFRSLQVAYQATRNPTENRMTQYDIGTRVVLWVSALEILLHAGLDDVRRGNVTAFIAACPWLDERLIDDDVPKVLCNRLYDTRNDFAHGNDITAEGHGLAFPEIEDSPHVVYLAPILYWMALREKIGQLWPELPYRELEHGLSWFGDGCIETLRELYIGEE